MTLTKDYNFTDNDGDYLYVEEPDTDVADAAAFVRTSSIGFNVDPKLTAQVALLILGHDRPDDDPLATKFEVGVEAAYIASTQYDRDRQLNIAAAMLMAVDGYDRRAVRLATAEERRKAAAKSLTAVVLRLRLDAGADSYTGDDIGKLREALGKYDAALAN